MPQHKFKQDSFYDNLALKLAEDLGIVDSHDGNPGFSVSDFYMAYQLHGTTKDGKSFSALHDAESLCRFNKVIIFDEQGNKGEVVVPPYALFESIRAFDASNKNNHLLEKSFLNCQIIRVCEDLTTPIKETKLTPLEAIGDDFQVSINVNPEIFDEEFVAFYKSLFTKFPKLKPENIAIELVETGKFPTLPSVAENESLTDYKKNKIKKTAAFYKNMQALQAIGTKIYLDDFNSENASEEVLELYPWDAVKVDRNLFVELVEKLKSIPQKDFKAEINLPENSDDDVMTIALRTLINKSEMAKNPASLGHAKNLLLSLLSMPTGTNKTSFRTGKIRIVLEGVDNEYADGVELINKYFEEPLKKLYGDQIDLVCQGYAINHPEPIKDITEKIQTNQKNHE
ncbi:MAG: EAL domain-containing protein [Clostridia bacterium]|nr:EAL domain-containing protein [Clostridia bacterium]